MQNSPMNINSWNANSCTMMKLKWREITSMLSSLWKWAESFRVSECCILTAHSQLSTSEYLPINHIIYVIMMGKCGLHLNKETWKLSHFFENLFLTSSEGKTGISLERQAARETLTGCNENHHNDKLYSTWHFPKSILNLNKECIGKQKYYLSKRKAPADILEVATFREDYLKTAVQWKGCWLKPKSCRFLDVFSTCWWDYRCKSVEAFIGRAQTSPQREMNKKLDWQV